MRFASPTYNCTACGGTLPFYFNKEYEFRYNFVLSKRRIPSQDDGNDLCDHHLWASASNRVTNDDPN
jgi:hypothetical protein